METIGIENDIVNAGEITVKKSQIPHEWFVALANCNSVGLQAEVKITFLNEGHTNAHYNAHFGVDEQGIYEMNIFFIVMYSVYGFMLLFIVKKFHEVNVSPLEPSFRPALAFLFGALTLV